MKRVHCDAYYELLALLDDAGILEQASTILSRIRRCLEESAKPRVVSEVRLTARPSGSAKRNPPRDIYVPYRLAKAILGEDADKPEKSEIRAYIVEIGGSTYLAIPLRHKPVDKLDELLARLEGG